jgi:hypothetical protein
MFATVLHAQAVLFRWDGDQQDDILGWSVASLPDVTGDGVPDVLVGAPQSDCGGTDFGGAYVYSGRNGTTYVVECGTGRTLVTEQFGWSAASTGDLDGDGIGDFVVGGRSYETSKGVAPGRACVYSGSSGMFLYQVLGEQSGNVFGSSVAGIGDVDKDGKGDFIVGAWAYSNTSPSNIGRTYVYSGANGSLIRMHEGEEQYDAFGWNMTGLDDIDLDGVPEYAVMAVYDPAGEFGAVYVYSGATGASLWKWSGQGGVFHFGYGLDGHLDWDGDGHGDVLVGAPSGLAQDGYVYVYSGKDGSTLATVTGEDSGTEFGSAVANVGDMNGDGYPEIIVGEPLNGELGHYSGRATLLSGRTLRRLYHFYGAGVPNVRFGIKASGGMDHDGDGIPDVLISEPSGSNQDPKGGRVTLFAGNDLFLQSIPNTLTAGDTLEVDARGGAPGVLSVLVIEDVGGTSMFLPIQVAALDSNGEMALSATVPSGLAGITVTLQSFAQHAPGKHGYVDSDRETITFY